MANLPQGNDTYLTDLDVRMWLRDNDPAANFLLDDLEFSTEEIRVAKTLAVDYWNEQPPYIGNYDFDKFPFRYNLLMAAASQLLFIAAHRYRRNALKYAAGGLSVADQDKYNEYDAAGARLWSEYKLWVQGNKRAINIERGYGIIG